MHKSEMVIDVGEVLETLGIRNVKRSGNEWNYSCPGSAHTHGDHRPSAYCRSSHPYPFICFGCGQQGTIVDLVSEYLGIDRAKSYRWLGERFGWDTSYDATESIAETLNRIFGPKSKPERKVLGNPVISPHGFVPLNSVAVGLDYITKRSLTLATINHFELQWDPRSGRVAIPIRDRIGNLIGFKARDITGEKEPKYLVLGNRKQYTDYGFNPYNSSLVLFGHNLIEGSHDTLYVVEGEFNCMKMKQEGIYNVVGLPTAAMSNHQACMIREEYENVILFLDSDEAGKKGTTTAYNMLQGACNVLTVPNHEGDPMEMTRDDIEKLIDQAQSPLTQTLNEMETTI